MTQLLARTFLRVSARRRSVGDLPAAGRRNSAGRWGTFARLSGLLSLLVVLALVPPTPADAHITGVFLYFLKDVQGQAGQASTDILKAQLTSTNARIAALQPQVKSARVRYDALAGPTRQKALFYDEYAGEAFAAAIFGSGGPIDALANLAMLRGVVGADLRQLRATATALATLQEKERELTGFRDLLTAFSTAETKYAQALLGKDTQDQELALYNISESWEQIRVGPFADYFAFAKRRLAAGDGLASIAEATGRVGRWKVAEGALNDLIGEPAIAPAHGAPPVKGVSNVHIFLRADHVYVVGTFTVPLGARQVILVGQFTRVGEAAVRYHVEYALIDGHLIPPSDPQMQGVIDDATMLRLDGRDLDAKDRLLQFEQGNGALWLYTRE